MEGSEDSSGVGDAVGNAVCVSGTVIPTVALAVSMMSVGLAAGVGLKLLQDANMTPTKHKEINAFQRNFISCLPSIFARKRSTAGVREAPCKGYRQGMDVAGKAARRRFPASVGESPHLPGARNVVPFFLLVKDLLF